MVATLEDFQLSVMLFGFMILLIALLPVLLHPSPAVKHVIWSLISNSIKILCGVLLGMTFSGLVMWSLGSPDAGELLIVHLGLYLFWYMFLQSALLLHIQHWRSAKQLSTDADDQLTESDMDDFNLSLKCMSPLLSIACSCSGMFVWAALQSRLVSVSPQGMTVIAALSMVIACFIVSEIMVFCMERVRGYINSYDGTVDSLDKAWNECVAGCERNLVSYQTSFLFVQSLRLAITGILPPATGSDPPGFQASWNHIMILFLMSWGFLAALSVAVALAPKSSKAPTKISRLTNIVLGSWGNTIAFCWLYSGKWLTVLYMGTEISGTLLQSASATLFGIFMLSVLVDTGDSDSTTRKRRASTHTMKDDDKIEKERMLMVGPLSFWIGFAWKESFKDSLTTITGYLHYLPEPIEAGILSIIVVSATFPSWKHYILVQEHFLGKAMTKASKCEGIVRNELNGEDKLCGTIFTDNSNFCRMCGSARNPAQTKGAIRGALKSPEGNMLSQPLVDRTMQGKQKQLEHLRCLQSLSLSLSLSLSESSQGYQAPAATDGMYAPSEECQISLDEPWDVASPRFALPGDPLSAMQPRFSESKPRIQPSLVSRLAWD